jgi:hypothetical protein
MVFISLGFDVLSLISMTQVLLILVNSLFITRRFMLSRIKAISLQILEKILKYLVTRNMVLNTDIILHI